MSKFKSLVYINNTTSKEPISYEVGIYKSNNKEVVLKLHTHPDRIYTSSDRKQVLSPSYEIELSFNQSQMIYFVGYLIESVSSCYEGDIKAYHENRLILNDEYYICTRIPKDNSRKKIVIDIFEDEELSLSFDLNRTKVIMLIKMIGSAFKNLQENTLTIPIMSQKYKFNFSMNNNGNIAFNNIWLRNNEVDSLKYLIDSIIFDYKYKAYANKYDFEYRQLVCLWSVLMQKVLLRVSHAKEDRHVNLIVTPAITAVLYLCIPEASIFKGDVINELF